jgi:hypothetical protein
MQGRETEGGKNRGSHRGLPTRLEAIGVEEDRRFGRITLLQDLDTQKIIFVKEKDSFDIGEHNRDVFQAKERLKLNSDRLLPMLDYSCETKEIEGETVYTVRGFYSYPESDLETELDDRCAEGKYFSYRELLLLYHDLVEATAFLQKQKMLHGDIRPKYIGINPATREYTLMDRLGDPSPPHQAQHNNFHSSVPLYLSPALYSALAQGQTRFRHNPYKSDAFSVGLVILEAGLLKSLHSLYPEGSLSLDRRVLEDYLREFNSRYREGQLAEGLRKMLFVDEASRCDMVEVLEWTRRSKVVHEVRDVRKAQERSSNKNIEHSAGRSKREVVNSGSEEYGSGYSNKEARGTAGTIPNYANRTKADTAVDVSGGGFGYSDAYSVQKSRGASWVDGKEATGQNGRGNSVRSPAEIARGGQRTTGLLGAREEYGGRREQGGSGLPSDMSSIQDHSRERHKVFGMGIDGNCVSIEDELGHAGQTGQFASFQDPSPSEQQGYGHHTPTNATQGGLNLFPKQTAGTVSSLSGRDLAYSQQQNMQSVNRSNRTSPNNVQDQISFPTFQGTQNQPDRVQQQPGSASQNQQSQGLQREGFPVNPFQISANNQNIQGSDGRRQADQGNSRQGQTLQSDQPSRTSLQSNQQYGGQQAQQGQSNSPISIQENPYQQPQSQQHINQLGGQVQPQQIPGQQPQQGVDLSRQQEEYNRLQEEKYISEEEQRRLIEQAEVQRRRDEAQRLQEQQHAYELLQEENRRRQDEQRRVQEDFARKQAEEQAVMKQRQEAERQRAEQSQGSQQQQQGVVVVSPQFYQEGPLQPDIVTHPEVVRVDQGYRVLQPGQEIYRAVSEHSRRVIDDINNSRNSPAVSAKSGVQGRPISPALGEREIMNNVAYYPQTTHTQTTTQYQGTIQQGGTISGQPQLNQSAGYSQNVAAQEAIRSSPSSANVSASRQVQEHPSQPSYPNTNRQPPTIATQPDPSVYQRQPTPPRQSSPSNQGIQKSASASVLHTSPTLPGVQSTEELKMYPPGQPFAGVLNQKPKTPPKQSVSTDNVLQGREEEWAGRGGPRRPTVQETAETRGDFAATNTSQNVRSQNTAATSPPRISQQSYSMQTNTPPKPHQQSYGMQTVSPPRPQEREAQGQPVKTTESRGSSARSSPKREMVDRRTSPPISTQPETVDRRTSPARLEDQQTVERQMYKKNAVESIDATNGKNRPSSPIAPYRESTDQPQSPFSTRTPGVPSSPFEVRNQGQGVYDAGRPSNLSGHTSSIGLNPTQNLFGDLSGNQLGPNFAKPQPSADQSQIKQQGTMKSGSNRDGIQTSTAPLAQFGQVTGQSSANSYNQQQSQIRVGNSTAQLFRNNTPEYTSSGRNVQIPQNLQSASQTDNVHQGMSQSPSTNTFGPRSPDRQDGALSSNRIIHAAAPVPPHFGTIGSSTRIIHSSIPTSHALHSSVSPSRVVVTSTTPLPPPTIHTVIPGATITETSRRTIVSGQPISGRHSLLNQGVTVSSVERLHSYTQRAPTTITTTITNPSLPPAGSLTFGASTVRTPGIILPHAPNVSTSTRVISTRSISPTPIIQAPQEVVSTVTYEPVTVTRMEPVQVTRVENVPVTRVESVRVVKTSQRNISPVPLPVTHVTTTTTGAPIIQSTSTRTIYHPPVVHQTSSAQVLPTQITPVQVAAPQSGQERGSSAGHAVGKFGMSVYNPETQQTLTSHMTVFRDSSREIAGVTRTNRPTVTSQADGFGSALMGVNGTGVASLNRAAGFDSNQPYKSLLPPTQIVSTVEEGNTALAHKSELLAFAGAYQTVVDPTGATITHQAPGNLQPAFSFDGRK